MQTPLNGHIVLPSKSPSVIPIVAPSSSTEEQSVKTMPKIPSKGYFFFFLAHVFEFLDIKYVD